MLFWLIAAYYYIVIIKCFFLEVQNADGSLMAVMESPRVECKRRPRWKWSPISTQILTEAFKKVQQ